MKCKSTLLNSDTRNPLQLKWNNCDNAIIGYTGLSTKQEMLTRPIININPLSISIWHISTADVSLCQSLMIIVPVLTHLFQKVT